MSKMKIQSHRQKISRAIPAIKLTAGDFEAFGGKFLDDLLKTWLKRTEEGQASAGATNPQSSGPMNVRRQKLPQRQ